MSRTATCPQCHRPLEAGAERWRPFCSERCRLMDLGQWFAGRYSIPEDREPGEPAPESPDHPPPGPRQ